ncbi:uncharacterized protein PpBr36_09421 [Pyricularia pennisetigena]|uniref:uncharacterized protein n=1 Tax=Pyricularia pennisetigena TaxID=1578925 RepID=UPI001150B50B|nr:uncharacterized protein PpBr36_09421 [Pyricularia pennisetigena]TLS21939.1 hypothetical protein PpBr36_09421 [Pyricularia pennisetigena]
MVRTNRGPGTDLESRTSHVDENRDGGRKNVVRAIKLNGWRVQGLTAPIALGIACGWQPAGSAIEKSQGDQGTSLVVLLGTGPNP